MNAIIGPIIVTILFLAFWIKIMSNVPSVPNYDIKFEKMVDDAERNAYYMSQIKSAQPQQRHYQEMKAISDRQAANARAWEQELAEDWLDEHDDF